MGALRIGNVKMIETRYDIEYVSPNGKTKSGLGRFFAYLLLLVTLLIFLAALIFSNLSDSASQLVTQKIQQLTGINTKAITDPTSINNDVASDESIEDEATEETITASKLGGETHKADQKALASAKDENEKNKKELKRLSQENTKKSEASKKQQLENQKLSKNLERITKQLAKEKKVSDQLTKQIKILNNKNGALSKQLTDSKKSYVTKETAKADTVGRTDKLKEKTVNTEEPAKSKPVVATQEAISISKDTNKASTPKKQSTPISQMDAIVEAMKAAKK